MFRRLALQTKADEDSVMGRRKTHEKRPLERMLESDSCSPSVEDRLVEEETGRVTPPVGKAGLVARLATLLDELAANATADAVQVRLFSHYPTFALLINAAWRFSSSRFSSVTFFGLPSGFPAKRIPRPLRYWRLSLLP